MNAEDYRKLIKGLVAEKESELAQAYAHIAKAEAIEKALAALSETAIAIGALPASEARPKEPTTGGKPVATKPVTPPVDKKKRKTKRMGYGIDLKNGYIRHPVLRAAITALREHGDPMSTADIQKSAKKIDRRCSGLAVSIVLARAAVYPIPLVKREEKGGQTYYSLLEWASNTSAGQAAIRRLKLQPSMNGKLVAATAPSDEAAPEKVAPAKALPATYTTTYIDPALKATHSAQSNGNGHNGNGNGHKPVVVTAPVSTEPPVVDPTWNTSSDRGRIWDVLSKPQRDYVTGARERVELTRFATDPSWAAAVHRGEVR